MKISDLPSRRHPVVVSEDNPFYYSARDYKPVAVLDDGLIKGHQWGVRHARDSERVQYMVYDAKGRNVLSCQYTPELAALMANERLQKENLPPAHYSQRLQGCTFDSNSATGSHILIHLVRDENGIILGMSTSGRQRAAEKALLSRLCMQNVHDMSFDEFSMVTLVAPVQIYGKGKNSYAVYDGDGGIYREKIRKVLRHVQSTSTDAQLLHAERSPQGFVTSMESKLLKSAGSPTADVVDVDFEFQACEQPCRIKFLFTQNRISPDQALRHAYEKYLEESSAEQSKPHRERQRG